MTDKERDTVYRVRREFEEHRAPLRAVTKLYLALHPRLVTAAFVRQALAQFPKLNCGVATAYLRHRLGRGEPVHGNYRGSGHTFLELDEGLIVDITADQFSGPPVYIGPLIAPWSRYQVYPA